MAKMSMKVKQKAEPKFSTRATPAAKSVADPTPIFANLVFAASASENLLTKVRSLA